MLKENQQYLGIDLTDDSLFFMVGKLVADGDTQFVRSIYTLAATLDKQVKEFFMEDNF
jgi:hypothetical protein